MSYVLDVAPTVQAAIDVLPGTALRPLAEAFALIETTPWSGPPINSRRNPDGPVRSLPFGGYGIIDYLILERDRQVEVLLIVWFG